MINWILGFTKVGKTLKQIQVFFDGKKLLLSGIATAVPATVMIIQKFAEEGVSYLMRAASTPEFQTASLGWGMVFAALKGEKIREELSGGRTEETKEEKK